MFRQKGHRSERPFSIMLAEELLRFELQRRFGKGIRIFSCNIKATPVAVKTAQGDTASHREDRFDLGGKERSVNIRALVGPFDQLFPENPPEDRRRQLRRVEAACRLFSTEGLFTVWWPHFLEMTFITEEVVKGKNPKDSRTFYFIKQKRVVVTQFYESGVRDGVLHRKNAQNPCEDMCESQLGTSVPDGSKPRE